MSVVVAEDVLVLGRTRQGQEGRASWDMVMELMGVPKENMGMKMVMKMMKMVRRKDPWWPLRLFRSAAMLVMAAMMVSIAMLYGSGMLLERANYLGRQCFDAKEGEFVTSSSSRSISISSSISISISSSSSSSSSSSISSSDATKKLTRFAMVTCQDDGNGIPGRSFEGLSQLVTPNKLSYAKRHGYRFIDASSLLDRSRPPSWSKILAVRHHLANYDWVFWNDADSLVTNPTITLEDIIRSVVGDMAFNEMPDSIVTEDVTGINAGMFFFRNSSWSMQFLDLWWNQTSFIRPFGEKKSGDNDALKFLIRNMPQEERERHIRIPKMQCVFNSNLWRPSLKSGHRLVTLTRTVWQGVYSKGDFMVHLAGLNDKKTWIKKILHDIEEEEAISKNRASHADVLHR